MNKPFVLFCLLTTLSLAHAAEDEPSRFEITPFGGFRLSGSMPVEDSSVTSLEFGDGAVYGLSAGIPVTEGLVEFMWTHQDSNITPLPKSAGVQAFNLNVDQFHLNGLYYPPGFEGAQPYVMAGLGATRYAPTVAASDLTRFSWALGGGAKLRLSKQLALRLEAKWNPALASHSESVFCNSSTGTCFVTASGELMSQFDFTAGLSLRI